MRRRSLVLVAPRQLRWVAEEVPPPGPGEVLVETLAGAISVGSEVPRYAGTARSAEAPHYPAMTGYESLGRVLARGAEVHHLAVGQRVLAFYGHRTHALLDHRRVIAVPAALGAPLALLAILTCDVAHGVDLLAPQPGEAVLVTGCGAIGLLTVWTLASRGITALDVIEPLPHRRALALRLGARHAWAPADRPTRAAGYDVGLECSNRDAAFTTLQDRLRHGGRACILADGNREPLTLAPTFHHKELSVVASSDGRDYARHADWFFAAVRDGAPALEALYDLRIPARRLAPTFAAIAAGGALAPVKVLVEYPRPRASTR